MPDSADAEYSGSRAETRRRSTDAATPRPAVVWGRAVEPVAETTALPVTPEVTSTTAAPIEESAVDAAAIQTTAPIQDAAPVEHTTLGESTLQTSRRTRTTARTGVSLSEAAASSAAIAPASTPSRSAARRARTTALDVPPVTPTAMQPANAFVRPEPVMELRQVDATAGPAFPILGAAQTGSIAAVPVVDVPKRNRTRPVVSEPVAPSATTAAEPTATAKPAEVHDASVTAEPAPAAHEASVTAEPVADEHLPTVTAEPVFVAQPAFVSEPVVEEPVAAPRAAADEPEVDEFEAAARLFSFTGETPIQAAAETVAADTAPEADAKPHKAPRRSKKAKGDVRRAATASFSIGVMGIVGLLAVGMTTPAEAVAAASGTASNVAAGVPAGDVNINVSGTDSQDIQAYMAPAQAQTTALDRSIDYSTVTAAATAADTGIKNVSNAYFTNDPNSPIQWPFAVGCTISWGFGPRPGEFHEGVDFTPGAGAHVQAIADGVVRVSTDNGGGYGVMIIIDHIIDGKLVSSRYGHMQYGSRQVQVGDHVHVGEYIGRTGNTGRSYGAHTHLEILLNGTTPIDPIPWLRAHVK